MDGETRQRSQIAVAEPMPIGDQVEDRIIAVMKRFGYTGSDARTYIALVRSSPATGYELAARGGVPRSAIYGILKRLEQAGLVNAIPGKPARYIPMSPEHLVAHLETRFSRDIDDFRDAISQVVSTGTDALTWTVSGYDSILAEAERLINSAQENVFCSLWRQEADALSPALTQAVERGVESTLFSFTALPDLPGNLLSYDLSDEQLQQHWSRRLILITDRGQVLIGSTEGSRMDRAIVSQEEILVETATGNLVLDITLFGERRDIDTSGVVAGLTRRLAPIEALLEQSDER